MGLDETQDHLALGKFSVETPTISEIAGVGPIASWRGGQATRTPARKSKALFTATSLYRITASLSFITVGLIAAKVCRHLPNLLVGFPSSSCNGTDTSHAQTTTTDFQSALPEDHHRRTPPGP
jgi:hypothetical protein